jgi:hypothetical protein
MEDTTYLGKHPWVVKPSGGQFCLSADRVEFRQQVDAFLLVRIGASNDRNAVFRIAEIVGQMGHISGDVDKVAAPLFSGAPGKSVSACRVSACRVPPYLRHSGINPQLTLVRSVQLSPCRKAATAVEKPLGSSTLSPSIDQVVHLCFFISECDNHAQRIKKS